MLTPLPFTRHRLNPLADLLPVRTFFKLEGCESEFAKFTLLTLKAFLKARSQNVSGNKQQLVARATGCPKTASFPTNSRLSGQPKKKKKKKNDVKTLFSTLHHLSILVFATAIVAAFVLLGNSGLNFYCCNTQR